MPTLGQPDAGRGGKVAMTMDRRRFLADVAKGLAVVGASALAPRLVRGATPDDLASASLPSGTVAETVLHALPGKRPLLKRTYRPPNYQTPVEVFNDAFTPNDAFFVRYHHSLIPEVSREAWRLRIGGDAAGKTVELGFDDLVTWFETVEIPALCFCSG